MRHETNKRQKQKLEINRLLKTKPLNAHQNHAACDKIRKKRKNEWI